MQKSIVEMFLNPKNKTQNQNKKFNAPKTKWITKRRDLKNIKFPSIARIAINQYLLDNKMTDQDFSEKINVHRQTVGEWMSGQSKPSIENRKKIEEIFRVSIENWEKSDRDFKNKKDILLKENPAITNKNEEKNKNTAEQYRSTIKKADIKEKNNQQIETKMIIKKPKKISEEDVIKALNICIPDDGESMTEDIVPVSMIQETPVEFFKVLLVNGNCGKCMFKNYCDEPLLNSLKLITNANCNTGYTCFQVEEKWVKALPENISEGDLVRRIENRSQKFLVLDKFENSEKFKDLIVIIPYESNDSEEKMVKCEHFEVLVDIKKEN